MCVCTLLKASPMGERVRAHALKGEINFWRRFFALKGICPHSPTHWICFEKCANTHLKAVSHYDMCLHTSQSEYNRWESEGTSPQGEKNFSLLRSTTHHPHWFAWLLAARIHLLFIDSFGPSLFIDSYGPAIVHPFSHSRRMVHLFPAQLFIQLPCRVPLFIHQKQEHTFHWPCRGHTCRVVDPSLWPILCSSTRKNTRSIRCAPLCGREARIQKVSSCSAHVSLLVIRTLS